MIKTDTTGSVEGARSIVAAGLQKFRDQTLEYLQEQDDVNPDRSALVPLMLLRVGTGIGKSRAIRNACVRLVRTMRERGDMRAVVISVPRHELANEHLDNLRQMAPDLRICVFRGRNAPNTDAPGETMCRRPDDAAALARAGISVGRHLCQQGEKKCRYFQNCAYQRQLNAKADIWLVPHAALWREPPGTIKPAALFVDEDPINGAFAGFDSPVQLSLDDMSMPLRIAGDDPSTADLAAISEKLACVLRAQPVGQISLGAIRATGFTAQDMANGRRLSSKAMREPAIRPDTPDHLILDLLSQVVAQNRRARLREVLFRGLHDAMVKHLDRLPGCDLEIAEAGNGLRARTVRLRWKIEPGAGWAVPTLIADATADATILTNVWPNLRETVSADASMKFVHVRQVLDRTFAASSLVERSKHNRRQDQVTTRANVKRLRHYIEGRSARFPGQRLLVVAQKAVIKRLEKAGLPDDVETAHFGALSGLDRWRNVRCIIVIGRTMPKSVDVERRAEILGGRPLERLTGRFPSRHAHLNMHGLGAGPATMKHQGRGGEYGPGADFHPDLLAEALRWQVTEAGLLQAIGRGRGVNRTVTTPLQIDLITNVVLPIRVDEAGTFDAFEPTPSDMMSARGIVVEDTSAKGAWEIFAAVLQDVFPTADAARKAMERLRGHSPIETPIGLCPRKAGSARVRLPGRRTGGVPLSIAASTPGEADALVAQLLPGAELLHYEAPSVPIGFDEQHREAVAVGWLRKGVVAEMLESGSAEQERTSITRREEAN